MILSKVSLSSGLTSNHACRDMRNTRKCRLCLCWIRTGGSGFSISARTSCSEANHCKYNRETEGNKALTSRCRLLTCHRYTLPSSPMNLPTLQELKGAQRDYETRYSHMRSLQTTSYRNLVKSQELAGSCPFLRPGRYPHLWLCSRA